MLKYYFSEKFVHSFLSLSNTTTMDSCNFLRFSECGLGLISINDESLRVFNPNVIESSSLVLLNDIKPMMMTPTPPPLPPSSSPLPLLPPPLQPLKKKNLVGIGFIDEICGGVDGLMSCTESLGFESCEEIRVDDDDDSNEHHHHQQHQHMVEFCEVERDRLRKKKSEKKKRLLERSNKKFPPPLSSLNQNGQPWFYLKSVRKNGRLELTEIKIQQRPEILRAVRENGRLRLHLVSSHNEEEEEQEQEQEDLDLDLQEQEDLDFQEEEEEEKKVEELWKFEEGFRRCQENVMNHHHHHHHHYHHHINDHHSLLIHQDHHHHMNEHSFIVW